VKTTIFGRVTPCSLVQAYIMEARTTTALRSESYPGKWQSGYLACCSTMMIEALYSSVTSLNFYQTTRCHIPEGKYSSGWIWSCNLTKSEGLRAVDCHLAMWAVTLYQVHGVTCRKTVTCIHCLFFVTIAVFARQGSNQSIHSTIILWHVDLLPSNSCVNRRQYNSRC
jgi:hypothetical protein